jgi:hypothetical protein
MTHCTQQYTRETSLTQCGGVGSFKMDIAWSSSTAYRLRLSTVYLKSESDVRCIVCCIFGNFFVDIFLVSKSRCLTCCFRRHINKKLCPDCTKNNTRFGTDVQFRTQTAKWSASAFTPVLAPSLDKLRGFLGAISTNLAWYLTTILY